MRVRKGVGLDHRGDDGETRRVVEIGNDTSLASSENHRKTLSSAATKAGRLQRACLRLRDSPIKRQRATKAESEHRRGKLFEVVKAMKPMTVRQVFYQATVRGIGEKSEARYTKVQTDLVHMRRSGDLPYDRLVDNTRWQRKPDTFSSVERAVEETARFYRKALWDDIDAYAEIWLEKDPLSGVIYPIASAYDVPLMVARGYASLSFLHSAAEYINNLEVPAYIYHLGDFDHPASMPARNSKRHCASQRLTSPPSNSRY